AVQDGRGLRQGARQEGQQGRAQDDRRRESPLDRPLDAQGRLGRLEAGRRLREEARRRANQGRLAVMALDVVRLAPSPTGAQHVGNARTYLLAWLSARSRGGRVVLRIEDIDSPRVKAGAAAQALDDLRWLGLDWDGEPVVQTARLALYRAALDRLRAAELVYPCTCTRADVERAASAPHLDHE